MRLGKNQEILLTKLCYVGADGECAGSLSGTDMTPEAAAASLRSLERKGLVVRIGGDTAPGGPIATWGGTMWVLTDEGRAVAIETLAPSNDGLPDDHPDEQLAAWADQQIRAALKKGRSKGRSGWHDPSRCPIELLEYQALVHWEGQYRQRIDVAVLTLMAAWRRIHLGR